MHECFQRYLRMGTARTKEDKETEEKKQKIAKMERNKVGTK